MQASLLLIAVAYLQSSVFLPGDYENKYNYLLWTMPEHDYLFGTLTYTLLLPFCLYLRYSPFELPSEFRVTRDQFMIKVCNSRRVCAQARQIIAP